MHVIDYAMPPALLKDNVTKPLRPRHQLAVKRPFYNPTLIIPGAPLAMDVDVKLGVKQEAIDIKPADGVKLIDVDDEEVKPVIDPTPIDLTASSPAAEPAPIEEERPYWQKTLSEVRLVSFARGSRVDASPRLLPFFRRFTRTRALKTFSFTLRPLPRSLWSR